MIYHCHCITDTFYVKQITHYSLVITDLCGILKDIYKFFISVRHIKKLRQTFGVAFPLRPAWSLSIHPQGKKYPRHAFPQVQALASLPCTFLRSLGRAASGTINVLGAASPKRSPSPGKYRSDLLPKNKLS